MSDNCIDVVRARVCTLEKVIAFLEETEPDAEFLRMINNQLEELTEVLEHLELEEKKGSTDYLTTGDFFCICKWFMLSEQEEVKGILDRKLILPESQKASIQAKQEVNDSDFYTVSEVATILGVGERTVLRRIQKGKIDAIKIGNKYKIPKHSFRESLDYIEQL